MTALLRQKLPSLALPDVKHGGCVDIELTCDFPSGNFPIEQRPNLANLRGPKFRRLATLADLVGDVLCMRAEEEMVRPHAFRVVALVADTESSSDWPNEAAIGLAVCQVVTEGSVTGDEDLAFPLPAAFAPVEVALEGRFRPKRFRDLRAGVAAELPFSALHLARPRKERSTASFADSFQGRRSRHIRHYSTKYPRSADPRRSRG